jgi:putative DNA primase/helicase
VLDLTTGELEDHNPDEYHRTMVDVPWDPEAECPEIDQFLHEVVDGGDVATLYRLVAHALYKDYAAEKAAMLLGNGRNGKSVFLSLVEQFLGEWNVSNQSLRDLNEDEWAANNLVGKLANVHPDLSDQTINQMQMFKKLTGRDTVSADVKFESPVQFENHATLLFACNRMPVLDDDTRGNWRRWLLIDFPNTFEPDDTETEEKHVLMDRLTQESELQGLLVRCVEEISAWDDGRAWFPNAPDWEQTRSRIRRAAEPIYDFAHACLRDVDTGEGFETTDDVRRCYQAYAKAEGLPGMSREEFGRQMLGLDDYGVEKQQKRVDGSRVHAYAGIEFTSRAEELLNRGGAGDGNGVDQSSFGGPQGRAQHVVELCEAHSDGEPVEHNVLVGLAMAGGMDRERAEAAIQKARNQGDLAGNDGYLPT